LEKNEVQKTSDGRTKSHDFVDEGELKQSSLYESFLDDKKLTQLFF
jgi:hypothetical protein